MEQETGPYFDWVDSSVLTEMDTDFSKTFCIEPQNSHLQLYRFEKTFATPYPTSQSFHDVTSMNGISQLSDSCQIVCIRQKNSYSRLYISREMFQRFLEEYNVFTRIWDFVLPFSFKTRESDIGHAPFRFRQHVPIDLHQDHIRLGSFECAYGMRYVEHNHRVGGLKGNPDYELWSVRQSAIYQQYDGSRDKIVFLLISPSETVRKNLEEAIRHMRKRRQRLNPFDLHRIMISTLHENWRLYVRSLERTLKDQSDRVTLAEIQSEAERLSPLTDFTLNFVDRQRLKKIEDRILDLLIVFDSMINTILQLRRQCQKHCLGHGCIDCTCAKIAEELDEQMHEAESNVKKAKILHDRAKSTAHLLSDLLDYENAQIAHLNEKSLNGLVKETKEENSKMRILTERSTQDAAAVKILTVITLIYLPMTVVASFFSSQLIRVDDQGQVSVIAAAWWFVIISVPLTVLTFGIWRYWLFRTMKAEKHMHPNNSISEKDPMAFSDTEAHEGWISRCFNSWRKRRADRSMNNL